MQIDLGAAEPWVADSETLRACIGMISQFGYDDPETSDQDAVNKALVKAINKLRQFITDEPSGAAAGASEPALVSDQARAGLDPAGFDQAQGLVERLEEKAAFLNADCDCGTCQQCVDGLMMCEAANAIRRLRSEEAGWLIEVEHADGLHYHVPTRLTRDNTEALRFARKRDAQAFADAFLSDHRRTVAHPEYTRIAEHAWN